MDNKIIYVGICGATRSGKTTLSKRLAKLFSDNENKLIHLDKYFSKELVAKYNRNWEIPEVLKWDEVLKDVNDNQRTIRYQNKLFIIAEGFLLFKEPLFHNFDKSIFIWISKEECKKRRMATKPKTEEYFEKLLWANYIKSNYHSARFNKNKELKLGGDILVLDSTKETKEEMAEKSLKFILDKKELERDLEKEQDLLNYIENQYKILNECDGDV